MATYNKGILGGFSGTIGNVVGSSWRGIDYMRSRPSQVNQPNTQPQLAQRSKFSIIMEFLRKVKPLIQRGFTSKGRKLTSMNLASSYNLKNGVTGTYPDLEIDFPSVLVARGDLTPPQNPAVESTTPGQVTFNWTDNTGAGSAKADDTALLLVYSPELETAVYIAESGPERQEGTFTLDLPDSFISQQVEAYIAFTSAGGDEASDSQYLGTVTVAEP